jgi:pimeloyl-ACP methyl ester carboxylesterase
VGRLLVLLTVAVVLVFPAEARAAVPLNSCGKPTGVLCGTVTVPLDRSGATPGTIPLHVEVLPTTGGSRGVMFLVAGGPGQGSATSFDLGNADEAQFFQFLFPGYTLVAFDNRGTGKSGLIECPGLQNAVTPTVEQEATLARDCAETIGPTRQFYATRDHAADMEAVRSALGYGKIAIYGVSYGTKLALAYALGYPNFVDRMILDSVLPTSLPDPYDRNVLQAMPQTLQALCAGGRCVGITSDLAGEAVTVANRLEANPAVGPILAPDGHRITKRMNGEDLVSVIIDSDLNPGIQAALPAAIHAAHQGYTRPLLRLFDLDTRTSLLKAEDLSFGLYAATTCADVQFPWAPSAPPSERGATLSAAVTALPAGSFGPFGSWAARTGVAYFCNLWPSPAGNTPLGTGPLPNVPVLTFSGGLDFRTPTAGAAAVTNLFPQGHLVVVPGTGHNVLNQTLQSSCPFDAVRNWLNGALPPASCPRVPAFENPIGALPKASPNRSVSATAIDVAKTVREGEATALLILFSSGSISPSGLYGGYVTSNVLSLGFTLTRYSTVPGVRVSGKVKLSVQTVPLALRGTIRVSGPAAAAGTLQLSHGRLSGTLGGHHVSVKL